MAQEGSNVATRGAVEPFQPKLAPVGSKMPVQTIVHGIIIKFCKVVSAILPPEGPDMVQHAPKEQPTKAPKDTETAIELPKRKTTNDS